jgi:hypothetical protein
VRDLGTQAAPDEAVLERARADGQVLISSMRTYSESAAVPHAWLTMVFPSAKLGGGEKPDGRTVQISASDRMPAFDVA